MKQMFDNDEFVRIVLAYQAKLYGFARRMTHDSLDAEEVVQDAFFRAYRSLHGMSQEQRRALPIRPWLYTITRNAALNYLSKKRRAPVSLDGLDEVSGQLTELVERETPEAVAIDRASLVEVEQMLRRLPKHLQDTARLRFVHGYSSSQIAFESGKPLGTVKSHLHRAVNAMRRILKQAA